MVIPDAEIARIVNGVLSTRLSAYGFTDSKIDSGIDFDGTPVIRVKAYYVGEPIEDSDKIIDSVDEIRSTLFSQGEDRHVFVTNVYSQEDLEEEDEG